MKVQDIFGAAPKTVLNKPYMQVREHQPLGTEAGTNVIGFNDRILNTVLINEISGSSLVNNEVLLPAGTYYIEASAPCFGAGKTYLDITDSSDNTLIHGVNHQSRDVTFTYVNVRAKGQVTLSTPTYIKLRHYTRTVNTLDGLGAGNDFDVEVFSEMNIWKLDSTIETPVVSDPTMVLARPLMHVQHREPDGVSPSAPTTSGWHERELNTILTNEILGSSLSSNEVTLPAGTYYIEGQATIRLPYSGGGYTTTAIFEIGGTYLIYGMNDRISLETESNYSPSMKQLSGQITLTETTRLELRTYISTVPTGNVFGQAITGTSGDEVYSELKIWQLDAVRQTPVLINDKLYPLPGDTMVTGNMYGLEYEYTSTNSITVQPGICMDSTNTEILELSAAQVVTIGSVINTIYNLFLCDDGVIRTDTDVNGANLVDVDSLRWIGFVRTNASGDIVMFIQSGDTVMHNDRDDNIITATTPTSYSTVDHTAFIPVSRIREIRYGVYRSSTTSASVQISLDGINTLAYVGLSANSDSTANGAWSSTGYKNAGWIPFDADSFFDASQTSTELLLHGIKLKR